MRSLMKDVTDAPAEALLAELDSVLNSNTVLLKARADVCIRPEDLRAVLDRFIRSRLFSHTMRVSFRVRQLDDLHRGRLLPEAFDLDISVLSEAEFGGRLRHLLTEAFSPYRHHVSPRRADELAERFLDWLYAGRPVRARQYASWSFCNVRPNFLQCTGCYINDPDPPDGAYFDGGDTDTATFIYRNDIFLLLLTNGCP